MRSAYEFPNLPEYGEQSWCQGANFSTVEIGKTRLRKLYADRNIKQFDYRGWETEELRKKYGYKKTSSKSAEKFTAHCADALTLAVDVSVGQHVEVGPFLVVDDTYRPKRRRLHDTQPAKGGIRARYSEGTVLGLRKGLLIGTAKGKVGQLCGELKGSYRFLDSGRKRQAIKVLGWISSNFITRKEKRKPRLLPIAKARGSQNQMGLQCSCGLGMGRTRGESNGFLIDAIYPLCSQ